MSSAFAPAAQKTRKSSAEMNFRNILLESDEGGVLTHYTTTMNICHEISETCNKDKGHIFQAIRDN
jgi:hypothetical protein